MGRKGFALVEVLVALALLAGLTYLASQLLLGGSRTTIGVVEGEAAAANLAEGLAFVRSKLGEYPTPVVLQASGQGFAALQRVRGPYPVLSANRGEQELTLREAMGITPGSLLLLYGPGGRVMVASVPANGVQAVTGGVRVRLNCALPFSQTDGLQVYLARPFFLAMGSTLSGVSGVDQKTLYWSQDGASWRPVVGGLGDFRVEYRYRKEGIGEARDNPTGYLQSGAPAPSLSLEGATWYLSELVLYGRAQEGNRDLQVSVPLVVGQEAARVASLVGCGLGPAMGILRVEVLGLPQGVAGEVRVEGPGGFSRTLSATEEFPVNPGTYTATARDVQYGRTLYEAQVRGSPAAVPAGGRTTITVEYRPVRPAYIDVRVQGLPSGAQAPVQVREAGQTVAQGQIASGSTQRFEVRAGRAYEVVAQEVAAGGKVYRAASPNPVSVPPLSAGGVAQVVFTYYCASCSARLRVDVAWEPSRPQGTAADILVEFPDGTSQRLSDGATLDTVPGPHTVRAFTVVGSNGLRYGPDPGQQTVSPPEGGTGTASVRYRALEGRVRVRVEGLPQGLTPSWSLDGTPYTDRERTLLVPAGRYYSVTAQDVPHPTDRMVRYVGTPDPASFYLPPAGEQLVVIRYREQVSALIRVFLGLWPERNGVTSASGLFPGEKGSVVFLSGSGGTAPYWGSASGEEYLVSSGTYSAGAISWVVYTNYGWAYTPSPYLECRRADQNPSAPFGPCPSTLNLGPREVWEFRGGGRLWAQGREADYPDLYFFARTNQGDVPLEGVTYTLSYGDSSVQTQARFGVWLCSSAGSHRVCGPGDTPFPAVRFSFPEVLLNGVRYRPLTREITLRGEAVAAGLVGRINVYYEPISSANSGSMSRTLSVNLLDPGHTLGARPVPRLDLAGVGTLLEGRGRTRHWGGGAATIGLRLSRSSASASWSNLSPSFWGAGFAGPQEATFSWSGDGTTGLSPEVRLFESPGGPSGPVPPSSFALRPRDRLYFLAKPGFGNSFEVRQILSSRAQWPPHPMLESQLPPVESVEGHPELSGRKTGRLLLPGGTYRVLLATDGTLPGSFRATVYRQALPPTTYYGGPSGFCTACSEVSFTLLPGEYVEIRSD